MSMMMMNGSGSDAAARGSLLDLDDAPQCGHEGPHGSRCVIRSAGHGTHMDADGREWARPRAPLAAAVTLAAALAVSAPETPAPAASAVQPAPQGPQPVPYAAGWTPMMARFASRCGQCSAQIQRGDSIGWHAAAREARHDRCVPRNAQVVANHQAFARDMAARGATPSQVARVMGPDSPAVTNPDPIGAPGLGALNALLAQGPAAPVAASVVAPAPVAVQYHLARAGEVGGGFWVNRVGGSAMSEGRVQMLDGQIDDWYVVGRIGAAHYPTAYAAAAALTGAPEAAHAMAPEGAAAPSITGRPRVNAQTGETPQQRAQRIIGVGVTPTVAAVAVKVAPGMLDKVADVVASGRRLKGMLCDPDDAECGALVLREPLEGRKVTVSQIADAWRAQHLPDAWLLDAATDVAALGRTMAALNRGGRLARSVNGFSGRWEVSHPVSGPVGSASHVRDLTVELDRGALVFTPADHPSRRAVTEAYDAARAGLVDTSQIRAWLDGITFKQLGGSRVGTGARFIPGAARGVWARVQAAMKAALDGADTITTVPVRKGGEVVDRVRSGLIADAMKLVDDIRQDVIDAPGAQLGTRAARAAMDRIAECEGKLNAYELIVGAAPGPRADLAALRESIRRMARDAQGRAYRDDTAAEQMRLVVEELEAEERRAAARAAAAPAVEI